MQLYVTTRTTHIRTQTNKPYPGCTLKTHPNIGCDGTRFFRGASTRVRWTKKENGRIHFGLVSLLQTFVSRSFYFTIASSTMWTWTLNISYEWGLMAADKLSHILSFVVVRKPVLPPPQYLPSSSTRLYHNTSSRDGLLSVELNFRIWRIYVSYVAVYDNNNNSDDGNDESSYSHPAACPSSS
jgi:hypothetical protein